MRLETLVSIAETGPWCATRLPAHPRLRPSFEMSWDIFGSGSQSCWRDGGAPSQSRHEIFGPEPDPWRLGAICVGLYGAIALYQMGCRLSGAAAKDIRSAAFVLFDEICGPVPSSELIWLLLNHPPPAPPPWLNALLFAGEMLGFAQASQHEEMALAAGRQIASKLEQLGLHTEHGRAAA